MIKRVTVLRRRDDVDHSIARSTTGRTRAPPTSTASEGSASEPSDRSGVLGSLEWRRRRDRCSSAQARAVRNGSRQAPAESKGHGRRRPSSLRRGGRLLPASRRRHRNLSPVSMPWRRIRPPPGHVLPCVRRRRPVRLRRPLPVPLGSALPEQRHPLVHLDVAPRLRRRVRPQRRSESDRWQLAPCDRQARRPRRWQGHALRSRPPTTQRCGDRQRSTSAAIVPSRARYALTCPLGRPSRATAMCDVYRAGSGHVGCDQSGRNGMTSPSSGRAPSVPSRGSGQCASTSHVRP